MSEVAAPPAPETVDSTPPPASAGGDPWGSFYTQPSGGGAGPALKPKPAKKAKAKKVKKVKKPRKSKRGEETNPSAEAKPVKERRARRSRPTPGGRRLEDRLASFSVKRRAKKQSEPSPPTQLAAVEQAEIEPGLPPVAAPAAKRRYAEPHVLVGVVGGTIIALAALMIALLYMIGTAA
jgi:hypothetical protein